MQNNHGFNSIGIVGLGLIGGSFAKAFSVNEINVYGYDMAEDTVKIAKESGYLADVTADIDTFLSYPLDLIYICLPVTASHTFIEYLASKQVKCFVTDAGSVKYPIVEFADKLGLTFCGGHPIKGKETSGFENAEETLYDGALQILTPSANSDDIFLQRLTALHNAISMRVELMDSVIHDKIFALISHLPHIAAFCMVESALSMGQDALAYTGGGFRDFTRIAASDATMWADVFVDNSEQVLASIELYEEILANWKEQIKTKNYDGLYNHITKISNIRREL